MKKTAFLAIMLVLVFAFAACGGGKKSKPEVDEDPVETEDSDDEEAVVQDGDSDEENDGDSDQPGGNDDTPIVPDNDGPAADPCDPNPCTEANRTVCTVTGDTYTCSCDRLTCEINGVCYADGDRNPANSCEECNRDYSKTGWSPVADGRDCEAKAGLMGSGTCRNGVCGGFGTCDNRAYGLKAGAPCNRDVECETGYCYTWYDWSGSGTYNYARASVCTGTCKEDEDCPNNMTCQFMESRGYQCMPLFVAGVERPNPKMKTFGPCNVDDDCEGGMCLSYGEGESFCSKECSKNLIGDSCGSCGKCMEGGSDKGFKFDKYCVPKGSGSLGDHCQSGMDCSSGGCYDGYCTVSCSGILGSTKCTGTYECMENVYASGSETCIDSTRFNMPDGSFCNYDNQCASGECIEFEGDKICGSHCADSEVTDPETGETSTVKTCTDGSQCLPVKKVSDMGSTYAEYICAQDKMLKRLEFGEDCYSDWQCADGYSCFQGLFCSKSCTKDSECAIDKTCYIYGQQESEEGGEPEKFGVCISKEQQSFKPGEYCPYVWSCENCYTDYTIQQYYCTKSCESDADCFDIGGCYNGICRKAYPYRSDIYASCRFDDDCEKYTDCEHGMCTSSCSTDSNCDGYDAVTPTGTQKTCKTCETDTDCKKVFYDYGMCLTDYDGRKFCVEDCTDNYTLCPEGTRCNGSYCYPLSGSCSSGKAYCNSESNCAVPTLLDDWICAADKECLSGNCGANYCQSGTCSTDADCGCGFKECRNGNCVPKESLGTLESEPNDTLAAAQEVPAGFVFAGFGHKNNVEDFDYFKIKAKTGQYLKVRTHPYCGETRADTFVALFDADGTKVAENDYMDYCYFTSGYYHSEIMNYKVPADGYYYAMVRQNPDTAKALYSMPYILEFDAFTPAAHNVCSGAKELEPGIVYDESFKLATDSLDTKSCSGYYGYGPDLFYKVHIPAGKVMTFRVTPGSGAFYPTISVLSDCGEIADTCLAGNSFGGFGNPEEIVFANNSGADGDYIVVVDTVVAPLEYDFTIQIDISDTPAVPANDKIEGVMALEGRGSLQGQTISAEDDFAPAQGICQNVQLAGKDVVYSMNMADGDYFHAEITSSFAAAIYVVKADDPDTCLYGGGIINFETDATTAGLYYLVIDSTDANAYGTFSIVYIKEAADIDQCKGICTSSYRMCLPDKADICFCNESLGILYSSNCDSYCISEGGTAGTCETTYTDSGSVERNGCICTYDCSDAAKVAELCSNKTPSSCTCGSSDVCSWKNNGTCDKMCSDFFPSDHFDDSADCN